MTHSAVEWAHDLLGVSTITLSRPPVNAFGGSLVEEFARIVAEIGQRDDITSVVVTGGSAYFSAGADLHEVTRMDPQGFGIWNRGIQSTLDAFARLPQITIAAIDGVAMGGGLELALAADLRVCGAQARIGLPELGLGLIPGAGGTQRLPRLIGLARARYMILSGQILDAQAALASGVVDEVVNAGHAATRALVLARQIAAHPTSARLAKRALACAVELSLADGLQVEAGLIEEAFAGDEATTGLIEWVSARRSPRHGRTGEDG